MSGRFSAGRAAAACSPQVLALYRDAASRPMSLLLDVTLPRVSAEGNGAAPGRDRRAHCPPSLTDEVINVTESEGAESCVPPRAVHQKAQRMQRYFPNLTCVVVTGALLRLIPP